MRTTIITDQAPLPVGPYSQAIKVGGFIFVSGQIPIDPKTGNILRGDIKKQARQVFKNIQAILEAGDSSLHKTIKLSVFLKDLNDFDKVNEVFQEVFAGDHPARETAEISRLPKDAAIEISVIAEASTNKTPG